MIGVADPGQAETDLAAGVLTCPSCTGPLQPWGHARARTVRDHGTTVVALRPRRARCRTCRGTHVLLPAVVAPRRADTTAVIGAALQASARGTGYRRIAAELQRPLSTVRRWIRAVRDPAHVEWLRTQGMVWLARVDLDVINSLVPQATRLGVGFQNPAVVVDQGFQAAGSYWLISPPRTGRRRILPRTGSGTGDRGRGGRSWRARCGRCML